MGPCLDRLVWYTFLINPNWHLQFSLHPVDMPNHWQRLTGSIYDVKQE